MGLLVTINGVTAHANVTLKIDLRLGVLTVRLGQFALLRAHPLSKGILIALELLRLFFDDFELSVEHELLTFHLKALLGQVLERPIEIAPHLAILVLEQADVLVRGLIVVVHASNARLLLILDDLLAQDFELQLHEMDLLLQVNDIIIGCIDIRVLPELARIQLLLLLTTEVHGDG